MAMMLCFVTADAWRQELIQINDIDASVEEDNTQPNRLIRSSSDSKQRDLTTLEEMNQKVKNLNLLELEAMFDETEAAFRAGIGSMSMVRDILPI
jgi:hypothetical protein